MDFIYPLLIAFIIVFISELGDKTQLLVLSFSARLKSFTIILGVALGSFLSHGLAIIFGSTLGSLDNGIIHSILEFVTYISFVFFGVVSLIRKKTSEQSEGNSKNGLLKKISNFSINYIFIIAFTIAVGEIGDKTFLASLGLGINYPNSKLYLILGAVLGMIVSDSLAILLGKFLSKKIPKGLMEKLSSIIFLLFGSIGLIRFFALINHIY